MVISDINLITQILLCLLVKSLLVFKSVSKQWLCLISDPPFVRNHCLRSYYHLSIPGLFWYKPSFPTNLEFEVISLDGAITSSTSISFNTLTFADGGPRGIKIKQSCNGIFCCSSFEHGIGINPAYYIYNPSTKHYKRLRLSPYGEGRSIASVCSVTLAFDPIKSSHYEAVCIWSNHKGKYKIEIYASEKKSWKFSADVFSAAKDVFSESGVFWNGSLWISWTNSSSSLYFNIERELVRTMPMPPLSDGSRRRIKYFGEYKGHLHLIETYYSCVTTRFDILEMETDYSRWNLKYRVDLNQLEKAYPVNKTDRDLLYSFEFSVLLVVEEEKETSKLVLQIPDNKVLSYDLKEMSFKVIHDLGPKSGFSVMNRWCKAYKYIPTLAHV